MKKHSDYFNWLYIMGMHGSISEVDQPRAELYKSVDKEINVAGVLLHEYNKRMP